jgi:hypothetical protein
MGCGILPNPSIIVATTGVIFFAALWFLVRKRRSKHDDNTESEFVQAGKIHELYIYPIKSCKPNKVTENHNF